MFALRGCSPQAAAGAFASGPVEPLEPIADEQLVVGAPGRGGQGAHDPMWQFGCAIIIASHVRVEYPAAVGAEERQPSGLTVDLSTVDPSKSTAPDIRRA